MPRPPRQVSQYDPDTGELINTFESIAEAMQQTGVQRYSIHQAASGNQHYAGGCIWSFEDPEKFTPPTREQIEKKEFENRSRSQRGKNFSQKTRRKISEALQGRAGLIGRQHSPEAIEKLREATTGRIPSEETRKKMSENNSRTGRAPKPVFQYTVPNLEFVEEYSSINEARRTVDCSSARISEVISGKHPNFLTAKGYHWSDHLLSEDEKRDVRAKLLKSPRFKKRNAP